MIFFWRRLSAACFYILGGSFFLAYVFFRNGMQGTWPAWWMQVADLPFLLAALLYGGLSLYLSLQSPNRPSRALGYVVAIPLILFFLTLVVLNFWESLAGARAGIMLFADMF